MEFKAREKREGRGALGGREGNACQETIVFAIRPNNYVCKNNATVNDLAVKYIFLVIIIIVIIISSSSSSSSSSNSCSGGGGGRGRS